MMEDRISTNDQLRHKRWIIALSILIPLAVAALFVVKIPNAKPLTFLPQIYANINALTAVVLIGAFWAVKSGRFILHERLMKLAIGLSCLFLLMYIAYHMTSEPTKYGGDSTTRYVYFFILITHIILSIAVIPLVLISFVRAWSKQFPNHKKIARITFPIWLYVAVTGVVVYWMISPYYTV